MCIAIIGFLTVNSHIGLSTFVWRVKKEFINGPWIHSLLLLVIIIISVSGPMIFNNLPSGFRESVTLSTVREVLKTHLFPY